MKPHPLLRAVSLALCSLAFASQAELANTASNWQTFETANFRVHYTPKYKQWALSSAREMEAVRSLIKEQQGRVLTEKVDAYIVDPFNKANGFAVPLSSKPYMALFATPPLSDSIIANSTGWQQLLVLHEYVHLVHLAQKSRSTVRSTIANWYDIYDASQIKGERWVAEGYATLLESKLTGRGRLYNNHVEAILQQFARQGALPSYAQLSDINDDFMSGSMAYLIGVRYLQWLEEKYGEETLDAVWTRWSAVKNRTFHQAFSGVYPDSAKNLYQRFIAEYTFAAMTKEASFLANESTLWMNFTGNINAPALSPNKNQLAVVEAKSEGEKTEITLTIYSTAENTEKLEEFTQDKAKLLKEDPQDVADKAPEVFARKQIYSLNQTNNRGINNPRWLDDDTIIFGSSSLAAKHEFHQDLFLWQLSTNTVKQLTHGANLRRFDIAADQQTIIAERSRYGHSQLVQFSLNDLSINKEITLNSTEHIYDFPRFKPDDSNTLAYLVSTLNNKWSLQVKALNSQKSFSVPLPENYQYLSFPEWAKNGESIYYVAGLNGETKLYNYHFQSDTLTALTSGEQAVTWPVVIDESSLLHFAINAEGPDIYQLDLTASTKNQVTNTTQTNQITQPLTTDYKVSKATMAIDESVGKNRHYGLGPQEGTLTLGESYHSASSSLLEFGYKSGDVLERFDWQVNVSQDIFDNVLSGTAASVRWRGWPVQLLAHGYQFNLKLDKQYSNAFMTGKLKESALFVEASYPYQHETLAINTFVQAKYARKTLSANTDLDEQYITAGFTQHWSIDKQSWGVKQHAAAHYIQGELSDSKNHEKSNNYHGSNGYVDLSGHISDIGLGVNYTWAKRNDATENILSLGGYTSTLVQRKAYANSLFSPELAFYRQIGNDYHSYQAYLPIKFAQLFYRRHEMAEQPYIDSYGVKGTLSGSFGFTGINNIALDFGFAQVAPEGDKKETQGWINLNHQW